MSGQGDTPLPRLSGLADGAGERADRESRPSPIDIHVGSRIRLRRTLLGMSQERLGEALGLTFQQVQKYERGANRISASTLYRLAQALDVSVSFFFDVMEDSPPPARDEGRVLPPPPDMLLHYCALPEELRRRVHALVKAVVESGA